MERGDAARALLRKTWTAARECWDFDPMGFEVDESGLLTTEDISEIILDIDRES